MAYSVALPPSLPQEGYLEHQRLAPLPLHKLLEHQEVASSAVPRPRPQQEAVVYLGHRLRAAQPLLGCLGHQQQWLLLPPLHQQQVASSTTQAVGYLAQSRPLPVARDSSAPLRSLCPPPSVRCSVKQLRTPPLRCHLPQMLTAISSPSGGSRW